MLEKIKNFVKEEEGASMVEYAVLIGIITAAVIGVIALIGGHVLQAFTAVEEAFEAAN